MYIFGQRIAELEFALNSLWFFPPASRPNLRLFFPVAMVIVKRASTWKARFPNPTHKFSLGTWLLSVKNSPLVRSQSTDWIKNITKALEMFASLTNSRSWNSSIWIKSVSSFKLLLRDSLREIGKRSTNKRNKFHRTPKKWNLLFALLVYSGTLKNAWKNKCLSKVIKRQCCFFQIVMLMFVFSSLFCLYYHNASFATRQG